MKTITIQNNIEKNALRITDCGISKYSHTLQLQHQLQEQRRNNEIPDTILIVEHLPVITLGARKSANILYLDRNELEQKGIDVVEIRRGGGTTTHNPGQLVFYPILNLQKLSIGINEYVRKLEIIGIELLEQYNLECKTKKGFPGLWIGKKKIASIGVRVSRFITYHGMAINIQNDLEIFDYIKPCGLDNIEITSLFKETSQKQSMTKIKERLAKLLIKHFS